MSTKKKKTGWVDNERRFGAPHVAGTSAESDLIKLTRAYEQITSEIAQAKQTIAMLQSASDAAHREVEDACEVRSQQQAAVRRTLNELQVKASNISELLAAKLASL